MSNLESEILIGRNGDGKKKKFWDKERRRWKDGTRRTKVIKMK
jgi:hypothetical protein